MPLKINVGLGQKVSDANYGSRGASINVECEADSALVNEPSRLQERIRQMFNLVRAMLTEELNCSHTCTAIAGPRLFQPNGQPAANGQGGQRLATPNQIRAIIGLLRRHNGNLPEILVQRFHVQRVEDLTLRQASQFIDQLKQSQDTPA